MKMEELTPRVSGDGAEKHIPEVDGRDNRVTVRLSHPSERDHRVDWVCLVTDLGTQRKLLGPGRGGRVDFFIEEGERPVAAFAYCNNHGLWVREL